MNERPEERTEEHTPRPDALDAGLALAFGPDSGPPLPATASVVRALGIQALQLREPATEGPSPDVQSIGGEVLPPADPSGRLQLSGEIARGGMGAVFRGRDGELGREVAVKVLLEAHAGRTELVQRFVDEAQVAGQLQHPGVVPVYDIGQLADKRPYFTMKLVKGQTLAKLLAQRKDASEDRPRFLGTFVQVCQALAYAHARGVIHRDLKPSNVMVGAFGEVQVMDWGLAKVLSQERERTAAQTEPTSIIRTARTVLGTSAGSGSHTAAGQVMGTPAYMAPEQARGETDRLDERCDVFGLGAILCQILTRQPPYMGEDDSVVFARASQADLTDALGRLDRCGADTELIGLTKRCLAADRHDRPRDAGVLAAELIAYQESVEARLRQAELERTEAQVQAREEAKRKQVQLALEAAVLLLVVGGMAVAWFVKESRQERQAETVQRRQDADSAATLALNEARLLLGQAKAAPLGDEVKVREALAAARRAQQAARPGEASDEVCRQVADLVKTLEAEAEAVERDRRLLEALIDVRSPREEPKVVRDDRGLLMNLAEPSADEQLAAAFKAWGLNVETTPTPKAAARIKERPSGVVTEIVAALYEWDNERRSKKPAARVRCLADLAQALDDSPGSRRRELHDLMARGNLEREHALAMLALSMRPVPVPFDAGLGADRLRLRRLAEQTDPATEPVLGLLSLVQALRMAGDDRLAEALLRSARGARPREVILHALLGSMLAQQKRWSEAIECFAAVGVLRPQLGESLAYALVQSRRVEEGFRLYDHLITRQPRNVWLRLRHGQTLHDEGRVKEAEAAFRGAIRLKPGDYLAHAFLGNFLARQGRYQEAEAACRRAIHLDPSFAASYANLAYVLHPRGRFKEAEAACRQALRLQPDSHMGLINLGLALDSQERFKEAEAINRRAVQLYPDSYHALSNLGVCLHHQNRSREAEHCFREALRIKPDSALIHVFLGTVLNTLKRFREAEASCRHALRLQADLPEAHHTLGAIMRMQRRFKEAETAYRRAIQLRPNYVEPLENLGDTLKELGQFKEAEAVCRQALEIKPDSFMALTNLGNALTSQGRCKEAETFLREALRLKPGTAKIHNNLGAALGGLRRLKEAEAEFRQAIHFEPDYYEAHINLANALNEQRRFEDSETVCRQAIQLRPDGESAHYLLGSSLNGQNRFAEAESALRRAVRLRPDFPLNHIALGLVLREQGKFTAALGALRRGHALGQTTPGWSYPSAAAIRQTERLVALDRLLPAVLAGQEEPVSPAEYLQLAHLCRHRGKRLHRTAVRLAADAFAIEPRLADNLNSQARYNAACSAALAACCQGEDARVLPDKVVLALRRQALRWLRADLALHCQIAQRSDPRTKQAVRQRLLHWQRDADLADLRDREAVSKLPTDEREDWRKLWADVETLLQKCAAQTLDSGAGGD
jgi:serine/threonine-protein kinase